MWPMSPYPSLQRFPSYDYQPAGMSYGSGPAIGSRAHDVAMASLTNYVYDKDNFHISKVHRSENLILLKYYLTMSKKADFGLRISADALTAFIYSPEGKIRIIKDPDGNETTEYMVSFANNKVVVGKGAKEDLKTHPHSVIYDFFDMLGLGDEEIEINEEWEFEVFSTDGCIEIGFHEGEEKKRIEVRDLMALFLDAIKQNVEDFVGCEVSTVKVHVQLGITAPQKATVLQAIQMIGLSTV
uniref:Uncharacterized protein n=1 Tax=Panagrolaimus sp. ES5 TaxID=591445 RepID=A0AC34F4M4_9BILA